MNRHNARRILCAALCLGLTALLVPCAVEGQSPAPFVPPPPTPISGQPMAPAPAPPSSHALPPPPPQAAPGQHVQGAASPFLPASAAGAQAGRARLLRRSNAANPPEKGRLRNRIRGLFQGGNARN